MIPPHEVYAPRIVTELGIWTEGTLRMKVYGLISDGQTITEDMRTTAQRVWAEDLPPQVAAMGDSNQLGFMIVHPGTLGVTISCHWWAQGSVLCQHLFRQLYGAEVPMDTASRPVIGCVYELEVLDAERAAWRRCMMGKAQDPEAYLAARMLC